jgi:hypothetical protein
MTTAEAVKHLREISCETAEMRAKIADLLEAKDAECKAWRDWHDGEFSSDGALMESASNVDKARSRCDELENP